MYRVVDPRNLPLITSLFKRRKSGLEHALKEVTAEQVTEIEAFDKTYDSLLSRYLFDSVRIWYGAVTDYQSNPNFRSKQGKLFGDKDSAYLITVEFEVTGSLVLFSFYTEGVIIHGPSYKPKFGKFTFFIPSDSINEKALKMAVEDANKQLLQTRELIEGANKSVAIFNSEMVTIIKSELEKKRVQ